MIRKISTSILAIVIIFEIIANYNEKATSEVCIFLNEEPVKVAVFLSSFNDSFIATVKSCIEDIQKKNIGKVEYIFFDGKRNQAIQNREINVFLEEEKVDLIILNLINQGDAKYAIDRIKEYNIPVVFFGGTDINKIKSYSKAYWVGMTPNEGGVLQGEVLVKLWRNNKEKIDKNNDSIMQYVMITGPMNDVYAIERTKYSILTVNKEGIKTEELASFVSSWSMEEAEKAIKESLLKFGNKIEMIVVNNDSMALGVIKALNENGYNIGDERMTIPVIGFDGVQEAKELIKKGVMAGTVIQEICEFAKALHTVGMNTVNNKKPVDGTEYKTDATGISIFVPYQGIMTYDE